MDESYDFNVGGYTGFFAALIILLPCIAISGFIRDLVGVQKLVGLIPMIAYLGFILWQVKPFIRFCKKLALLEMKP